MKKSRATFLIILTAIMILSVSAAIMGVAWLWAALAGVLSAVWWSVYWHRLHYAVRQGILYVNGGIIFRRRWEIPTENILWTTQLTLPHHVLGTVLHTSGGRVVIFAEFSTAG